MKKLLLCLIRFYQKHISPAFPPRCRFTPTCSQYALEAVERQPAGPWILIAVALGFVAFGAFSFIEARFRRIRPPRDLNPLA